MAYDAATYEIDPLTLTTPKARLEYLRDFLGGLPAEKFDMRHWVSRNGYNYVGHDVRVLHECDTAACIGGWTESLFGPNACAETLLGLNSDQAGELFYAWHGPALAVISPRQAADVIDHLIRTGKVDWWVARKADA